MENTYIIEEIVQNIFKTQLFLLPVVLFALLFAKKKLSLTFQWKLHRIVIGALVITPLLFLLPVEKSVTDFSKNVVNLEMERPDFIYQLETYSFDFNTFSIAEITGDTIDISTAAPAAVEETTSAEKQQSLSGVIENSNNLPVFSLIGLISVLFTLASLIGIGRLIFQWVCQTLFLNKVILYAQKRAKAGKIEIIYSSRVTTPFSAGLLKKRIYLPLGYLKNNNNLRAVLQHELIHIKEGHIYWTFAEKLLTALFWYNPYIHILHNHGENLREFLCDKAVSEKITPIEYGKALLHSAEEQISSGRIYYLSTGWRKQNIMKERITKLFDSNNKKNKFTALLLILAGIVTFCMLLGIAACSGAPAAVGVEESPNTATQSEEKSSKYFLDTYYYPDNTIEDTRKTLTIRLWFQPFTDELMAMAKLYAQNNPDVRIAIEIYTSNEQTYLSDEYHTSYRDQLNKDREAGKAPDIFWSVPISPWDKNIKNDLVDLKKLMDKDPDFSREDYYTNIFDALTYDGSMYMLPTEILPMNWRGVVDTSVLEKSGINLTEKKLNWDILKDINNQLIERGDNSIRLFDLNATYFLGMTSMSYNHYITNTNGRIVFNSDLFLYHLKEFEKLVSGPNYIFNDNRGTYSYIAAPDYESDILDLDKLLYSPGTPPKGVTWDTGDVNIFQAMELFAMNNYSTQKEEAWKFMKFLISPEIQEKLNWGYSVNKEGLQKQTKNKIPLSFEVADKIMKEQNTARYSHFIQSSLLSYQWEQLMNFMDGKQSAEITAKAVKVFIEENYTTE